jgi:excisionase family DNA binding protein
MSNQTDKTELKKTYKVEEVADMLRIEVTEAYRQLKKGTIPGRKQFGRRTRVVASTFDRWLEGE